MEELIELQKKQFYSYENDEFPKMAAVLMREEYVNEANEEQLIQALEDKYDALRDKMIADSLMKQYGEAEWKALSEKERMAQLAKMKLEAKKLRREGMSKYLLVTIYCKYCNLIGYRTHYLSGDR